MRAPALSLPALVLLLLGAACGSRAPAEPPWRGRGEAIEVTVHDLHCQGCEKTIEDEIALVDGVEEVVADHVTDKVCVRLAAASLRQTAIPAIREAIHAAGKQVVGEDAIEGTE